MVLHRSAINQVAITVFQLYCGFYRLEDHYRLTSHVLVLLIGGVQAKYEGPKFTAEPIQKINTEAPRYNEVQEVQRPGSELQKPIAEMQAISPLTLQPQSYFCDVLEYNGLFTFFQNNPALDGDITDIAMRFTTDYNYSCTLKTVFIPLA